MEKRSLQLEHMGCNRCVENVTSALSALPGVRVEQVSIGSAQLSFDPAQTSDAAIASALADAGYPVRPTPPAGTARAEGNE